MALATTRRDHAPNIFDYRQSVVFVNSVAIRLLPQRKMQAISTIAMYDAIRLNASCSKSCGNRE